VTKIKKPEAKLAAKQAANKAGTQSAKHAVKLAANQEDTKDNRHDRQRQFEDQMMREFLESLPYDR
jgi:hypothetical protein